MVGYAGLRLNSANILERDKALRGLYKYETSEEVKPFFYTIVM